MVEDLIDELKRANIFSKIGLSFGYHQLRMNYEYEHTTTFKTYHGLCQFKVMPFVLTNTLATF